MSSQGKRILEEFYSLLNISSPPPLNNRTGKEKRKRRRGKPGLRPSLSYTSPALPLVLGREASQLCGVEFLEQNLSRRTLEPEVILESSLPRVSQPHRRHISSPEYIFQNNICLSPRLDTFGMGVRSKICLQGCP